jgi:hypothetical protein
MLRNLDNVSKFLDNVGLSLTDKPVGTDPAHHTNRIGSGLSNNKLVHVASPLSNLRNSDACVSQLDKLPPAQTLMLAAQIPI